MTSIARKLIDAFEKGGRRPIIVASHPRSGTHLLMDTLRLNFQGCSTHKRLAEPLHRLYVNLDTLDELDPAVAVEVVSRSQRPVLKTHALPGYRPMDLGLKKSPALFDSDLATWLNANADILYIYRDGRSSLASMRMLMQGYSAQAQVPLGQFVRQRQVGMSRAALWAQHVQGWVDQARVVCVTMEELLRQPEVILRALAEHLKLPPPQRGWHLPEQPATIFRQRITRILARRPQSTAILPRNLQHPTWQAQLDEDDRRFFLSETGDLLVKLGYEDSDGWVNPSSTHDDWFPAAWYESTAHRPDKRSAPDHVRCSCNDGVG